MSLTPNRLLDEDRADYERTLDAALRAAPHTPGLAAVGQRLSVEQLRTMALGATSLITAAATTEYHHYVRLREELRGRASAPAPRASSRSDVRPRAATGPAPAAGPGRRLGAAVLGAVRRGGPGTDGMVAPQRWARMSYRRRLLAALLGLSVRPEAPRAVGRASRTSGPPRSAGTPARRRPIELGALAGSAGMTEIPDEESAGWFAVLAVLTVFVSGATAVLSLLSGYFLRQLGVESTFTRAMLVVGWSAGAVTVISVLVCTVLLVVTALRASGRLTRETVDRYESSAEVVRAREAWREALLERGILPFLRNALDDSATPPSAPDAPYAPTGRTPLRASGWGPAPTLPPRPPRARDTAGPEKERE
ncbi:hypothetical protein GCM10010280_30880 [Streptomyces pilosus]|uniref:Transmembrane protein n=2 Tax=Streptomyces pilosus TaxID=28893 RepID=A0A918BPV1_9ACTN|nr:hypothetical protein GCM10010280_30880 [Streptomyces pilosus]